jgi:hypothetical protein
MSVLLPALFLSAATANARMLDLGADCSFPTDFAPSATRPFELDWCSPREGDEVTKLLGQIASRWPAVFSARAPTTSLTLVSNTIEWRALPVREVYFLEAQNGATLRLVHSAAATDKYRMWRFANLRRAVIGGAGLKLSFVGSHPGLGTGDDTQAGLIEFVTDDGSTPELADFRANVMNAHSFGLYFRGGASGSSGESVRDRFLAAKVSGTFINSGLYINSGVIDLWYDPEKLHVMEPFARVQGWDGVVAGTTRDGVKFGCFDYERTQARVNSGAGAQYVRRISGGVTFEYGTPNANIFVAKYIGNGPTDPFRVRFKDFGFTGPTELTGLPAGVMVKKSHGTLLMKHDPLDPYGRTSADFRFIRFEQLPSDYGNGLHGNAIASGCAPGNATNNNMATGTPNIWRAEASRDGQEAQFVTALVDVTVDGVSEWTGMDNSRSYLQAAGSGADISPGPTVPDRTFGHVLRATGRTRVPGRTTLLDSSTVTGPGSWYQVVIAPVATDQGSMINPVGNKVIDTGVHGSVVIGPNATGTVIKNVNFTGSSRTIIEVGAGSDVVVNDICAPAGATIEGSGTVIYQGLRVTLPFTFAATSGCRPADSTVPKPPDGVTVD